VAVIVDTSLTWTGQQLWRLTRVQLEVYLRTYSGMYLEIKPTGHTEHLDLELRKLRNYGYPLAPAEGQEDIY
jgi:hypothetical protein